MPVQDQRPRFYEGQYIGAADLDAVVDHAQVSHARHALGAHSCGICIGLDLIERPLGGTGRREVVLQPGYAWDGFGRPIVVLSPYRLPEVAFERIASNPAVDDPVNGKGRLVEVWLSYDETRGGGPPPGFEDCDLQNQYSRVKETFRVLVGPQLPVDQRAPVNVAGKLVDATDALRTSQATAPKLPDASVPFQMFPETQPPYPRWLIFVGLVRWLAPAGVRGYFVDKNADPNQQPDALTRARRRYVGVVAEEIQAADRAIVLRSRGDDPKVQGRFQERIAAETPAEALKDLVWIEGNLRVEGDAKLAAGRLVLRDALGQDQGTALQLERGGDNPVSGLPGNRELRAVIGPDQQLDNCFIVGRQAATGRALHPTLVVQSGGKVGINVRPPTAALLEIKGDATGTALLQASFDGAAPPFNPAFTVTGAGDVGVGTNAPQAKLDLRNLPVTAGGSPLGQDKWVQIGNDRADGDDGKLWLEYGPQGAPLLVLSDRDDPPRIQFQQRGTGPENAPQFSSWLGHSGSGSNDLALMGATPATVRLGVNVAAPSEALDVSGKIKFRPSGSPYDLLALGASQTLRVVIGKVSLGGAKAGGEDFACMRLSEGTYRVTFSSAYAFEPVVLVSPIESLVLDNVVTLRALQPGSFEVVVLDVSQDSEGSPQDTAFSFVAFGAIP